MPDKVIGVFVDSYHVNIGVGDGAIHVLVAEMEREENQERYLVAERTIMVDNGRGETRPRAAMMSVIEEVHQRYTFRNPSNSFQLDAVVITHWHDDHASGVWGLLDRVIEMQLQALARDDPLPDMRLMVLKYKENGDPLTTIYAPTYPTGNKSEGKIGDIDEGRFERAPYSVWYAYRGKKIENFAKLAYGPETLLGRNLATGSRLRFDWNSVRSPYELLQRNPPQGSSPTLSVPGFYCVACCERVIGWIGAGNDLRNLQDFIDRELKNESSVAVIVLWSTVNDDPPRISHYFAGDLDGSTELKIGGFIRRQPIGAVQRTCRGVTTIKMSHHGATSSTTLGVLFNLLPRNIIASTGDEYGHIRWEQVFLLDIWMKYQGAQVVQSRPVITTCYPYYLCKDLDTDHSTGRTLYSNKKISIKVFSRKEGENYHESLRILYDHVNNLRQQNNQGPLTNIYTQFEQYAEEVKARQLDALSEERVLFSWIAEQVKAMWANLSDIPPETSPFVGGGQLNGGLNSVGHNYEILYIRVLSVNHDAHDGRVLIKLKGGFEAERGTPAGIQNVPPLPDTAGNIEPDAGIDDPDPDMEIENDGDADLVLADEDDTAMSVISQEAALESEEAVMASDDELAKAPVSSERVQTTADRSMPLFSARLVSRAPVSPAAPTTPATPTAPTRPAMTRHGRQTLSASASFNLDRCLAGKDPIVGLGDVFIRKGLLQQAPSTDPCGRGHGHSKTSKAKPVPAPPEPIRPSGAPDPNGFWLYASKIPASGTTANIQALSGGGFDDFVFALPSGVIGIQQKPSGEGNVHLVNNDDWRSWSGKALGVVDMSLRFDNTGVVVGSTIQLDALGNSHYFDTKFIEDALWPKGSNSPSTLPPTHPIAQDVVKNMPVLDGPGLIKQENVMILGLDTTKTMHYTSNLKAIFEHAGFKFINKTLIFTLIGEVSMALDPKEGSRNALWVLPEQGCAMVLRLQFLAADSGLSKFQECVAALANVTVIKIALIAKKTVSYLTSAQETSFQTKPEVDIIVDLALGKGSESLHVKACIEIMQDSIALIFTFTQKDVLSRILHWLVGVCDFKVQEFDDYIKSAKEHSTKEASTNSIDLRRLYLRLTLGSNGEVTGVAQFRLDLEASFDFGQPESGPPAIFLLSFTWTKTQTKQKPQLSLKGSLWCTLPPGSTPSYIKLMPTWEEHKIFLPITGQTSDGLDLMRLFGSKSDKNIESRPVGVPTMVSGAMIEIATDGVSFDGVLTAETPEPGSVPQLFLGRISLFASWDWGSKVAFGINVRAGLVPRQGSPYPPAQLYGSLTYVDKTWTLEGSVSRLYGANLYSLFNSDESDAIMDVVKDIRIQNVSARYTYAKTASAGGDKKAVTATSFSFNGSIWFGSILLQLDFKNPAADNKGWTFAAKLSKDIRGGSEETTIGSLVSSFSTSLAEELPSFITEVKFTKPKSEDLSLGLRVARTVKAAVFTAHVNIEALQCLFVQHKRLPGPDSSDDEKIQLKKSRPKRILKCSVSSIPKLEVPLLGDLTQPFDEMYFMWVQDGTFLKEGENKPLGITKAELQDDINSQLSDKILFKKSKKVEDIKPDEIVIAAGWHFVLVTKPVKGNPEVLIDYVFGEKKKKKQANDGNPQSSPQPSAQPSNDEKPKADPNDPASGRSGPSQVAAVKKKQGPISIENIGFKYKDGKLSIVMDAEFLLGPLQFALLGFSIGMNFGKRKDGTKVTLHDIRPEDFSIALDGMTVSFDKAPVSLAGSFIHVIDGKLEYYAGGIVVGFQPWLFQAAGFFGKTADADPYQSVFVYLKLEGPLISFGFADISGIQAAFGYNMRLRWPNVAEVTKFPFVEPQKDQSPKERLSDLLSQGENKWLEPAKDQLWLAAGLKVDAFQILSVDAVLVLQLQPTIKIGLFGVAICDIPNAKAPRKFAHVELGILAVIDPAGGFMKLEAQLSPNSYILDPSCHLTGGFAMYCWWKPQTQLEGQSASHEGDWVFSIGGYHQAYTVPDHYPRPERLQISWSLDDTLSITGQAYFAITPKCCMGGGRLRAALNVGLLSAWFDAYVDFLINYQPFHFMGDGGLSVGVRFTLDLLLVTLHIAVDIRADLHIEGPPVHGSVHVNFWVFGFDIKFGNSGSRPGAISLEQFYNMVLQMDTGPAGGGGDKSSPHIYSCNSGALPPASGQKPPPSSKDPWLVRGTQLRIQVTARFAITSILINGQKPAKERSQVFPAADFYAKPMWVDSKMTSEMRITIQFNNQQDSHEWFISYEAKPMPTALWDKYKPEEDPIQSGNNNITSLLNGDQPSMMLPASVILTAPVALPPPNAFVKFKAAEALKTIIYEYPPTDERRTKGLFPPVESSNAAWRARSRLDEMALWAEVPKLWRETAGHKDDFDPFKLVANAYAWDTSKPDSVFGNEPPKLLLRDWEQLVPAVPGLVA